MSDSTIVSQSNGLEIAVIGMAGRFPGARNVDQLWEKLRDGVESVTFFTDEELLEVSVSPAVLSDPNYVKAAALLDDIDGFDASFFGFSPREAEIMDPQHRLFLECAWEALEDAGYDPERYAGPIGVFAGVPVSSYYLQNLATNRSLQNSISNMQLALANDRDNLVTRVSYKLNLTGPSVSMGTGCSTSLVAVHLAIQSLLSGDSDICLAGGVSIWSLKRQGYFYEEGSIYSPDGHCRAFDAQAQGTIGGDGVGIVVLKRLTDALSEGDHIHAVIKGSAINNDGALKVGYTAPSIEGQARVIRAAQLMAEVTADSISYVEAHGTATALGDPIEVAALTAAFRATTEQKQYCALGSVKTNVGHLDTAAGVAGLIKTVLALQHKELPPSLHYQSPNPAIDVADSPGDVNKELQTWTRNGGPRRAGVSSFGIGGTNAHVIVEEAPPLAADEAATEGWEVVVLSGQTPSAVEVMTERLREHFERAKGVRLRDVAFTLQEGRRAMRYRRAVICRSLNDAIATLETARVPGALPIQQAVENPSVVFMFPGGGTQAVNMGRDLYKTELVFREQVDKCCELLQSNLGFNLRAYLYPDAQQTEVAGEQLSKLSIALPAIFVTEYALAKLWMSWGVRPRAMIGHSLGEYTAACLAGVFQLEDALLVVVKRAQLLESLPGGAMLRVALDENELIPLMGEKLSLAAINGPSSCVVSGPTDAIELLVERLNEMEVDFRFLHISGAAHSSETALVMGELAEIIGKIQLHAPAIPYISNVTGKWITAAEATDPNYWAMQLRQTVRFAEGVGRLLQQPDSILLEVGPGQTLATLTRLQTEDLRTQTVLASMKHPFDEGSDTAFILGTLANIWSKGVQLNWSGLRAGEHTRRVRLPTYPFEHQSFWIKPDEQSDNGSLSSSSQTEPSLVTAQLPDEATGQSRQLQTAEVFNERPKYTRPSLRGIYVAPKTEIEEKLVSIWQELFNVEPVGIHDNFFELGGSSVLALQLNARITRSLQVKLRVNDLLKSPTVAELSRLIAPHLAAEEAVSSSVLIKIQDGGSRLPLVVVARAGGGLFSFYELTKCLGVDQPVYGLQPPSVDGREVLFNSVEEEAACYIEALREFQPEGEYLLTGASFGGIVAFEMAQQLCRQNQTVPLLALIDSPSPQGGGVTQTDDDVAMLFQMLLAVAGSNLPLSLEQLRQLDGDEQTLLCLEQLKIAGMLSPEIELPEAKRIVRIWRSNLKAMLSYTPQNYPGRIVYFRASEQIAGQPQVRGFWEHMALGGIDIVEVPGNHFSMLASPNVEIIADHLKHCLDEIDLSRHAIKSVVA